MPMISPWFGHSMIGTVMLSCTQYNIGCPISVPDYDSLGAQGDTMSDLGAWSAWPEDGAPSSGCEAVLYQYEDSSF